MPRRITLIATSLALVVVLAGCGSDDDSADDERDTTTTTEEEATTTEADEPETEASTEPDGTTEPTDTTEAPDDPEEPEEPDTPVTSISIPEGADFCTAYATFDEAAGEIPSDTIEDIQAGSEVLRGAITELEPLAPAELADAMGLLVEATGELVDATADAATVEEAQGALTEVFTNEDFAGAAEAVNVYFDENCPQADDDQAEGEAGTPETVTPG